MLWEGPKPHKRLTATRAVQINERVSTSFCSWFRSVRNSAITRWNNSSSIASQALLKTRMLIWVEKRRISTIGDRMVQQTTSGRDYEFQEPTLRRWSTVRRENLGGESHGDREEFQSEKSEDDAEARKDFWSVQENFIDRHRIEPRVQLYVPREESFAHFTRFISSNETPPGRNIWSEGIRRRMTKIQMRSHPDHNLYLKVKANARWLVSRHSVSVRQNSSSNP